MAAEFLPIGQYPHNVIIEGSDLNVSEFSNDIKVVMQDFNKRHKAYSMKRTEENTEALMSLSNILAQRIYDYYVDKEDQSVVIDNDDLSKKEIKTIVKEIKDAEEEPEKSAITIEPKPGAPITADPKLEDRKIVLPTPAPAVTFKNNNHKALHELFEAGTTEGITKQMLKDKDFDVSSWGPLSVRGCKVANFTLYKEFSETTYKLSKS